MFLLAPAESSFPVWKEPPASQHIETTPYLLAPAGQRPRYVGQELDPPVVHWQSLIPPSRVSTEVYEVGVMVSLIEPP